jgi:hypothetical protein
MSKQIFRVAKSDLIKYYATSPSGKLLTQHKEDDGFTSHDFVVYRVLSSLPAWYDESMVYVHIICEAKDCAKKVGIRIRSRPTK